MKRLWIALAALLACGSANAQSDYPNKPVRLIVDSAAGSANDATARILADLKASGHLRVTHANRRNRYEVAGMLPLHPGDTAARTMAELVMRMSSLTMSAFIATTTTL